MNKQAAAGGQKPAVRVYTDGSCHPNPGPGGWAAIIVDGGQRTILKGGERYSTNNRMELNAALASLRYLPPGVPVMIVTDSQYLKRGVQEWMPNWIARGWKRKGGVLANVELWQQLAAELERRPVNWQWVRGHAGHPLNEMADRVARQAAARQ
jgi:ribonuclease HI